MLGRIVKDEAAHGVFGWVFLDWALPLLGESGRELIRRTALSAIGEIKRLWDEIRRRPDGAGAALASMSATEYLRLAERSMRTRVLRPFAARGLALAE